MQPYRNSKVLGLIMAASSVAVTGFCQDVNYAHGLDSSLGQLTKHAQSVVIGRIETITGVRGDKQTLLVTECTNIYGASIAPTNAFDATGWTETSEKPLQQGQLAILFVSSESFTDAADIFNSFRFDYQSRDAGEPIGADIEITGGGRGVIQEDGVFFSEALAAIHGYWSHLRKLPRDALGYAAFLSSLTTSRVDRVRDDANRDLRILIRYGDASFLKQLSQALFLNEQSKEYLNGILKWRESGSPRPVRDMQPTEADWNHWMDALGSTSRVTRLSALAEMLRPERREVVASSSARWHDKVLPLIESPEEDIRTYAAILLSYTSDKCAVGALINRLQSDEPYRRKAVWEALDQVVGDSCPRFDPDASREQREESIKQLRKWIESSAN